MELSHNLQYSATIMSLMLEFVEPLFILYQLFSLTTFSLILDVIFKIISIINTLLEIRWEIPWSKMFESFNRILLLLFNSLKMVLFKDILVIFYHYKYCLIYFNKIKNQPFLLTFLPLFQFFSLHISNFWESNSYRLKRWIVFLSLISFYWDLPDTFFFFFLEGVGGETTLFA